MELYHWNRLSLETIVQKACHAPAQVFDIKERGFIREGYWADLVLIDLHGGYTVNEENILYKCGWSPFNGHTFQSKVWATFVNGEMVYRDGALLDAVRGKRLEFDRD